MSKQAPSNEPPAGAETQGVVGGPQEPMPLTQEEVDALVAGTIDSAALAERRGAADVVTGEAEEELAETGSKANPTKTPPG